MGMIVFVLGAGASKDFIGSLPLGFELAEQIERALDKELQEGASGPISKAVKLSEGGFTDEHLTAMACIRDRIQSKDSVDDFLSEWQDVPHINAVAKIAISHVIVGCENRSALFGDLSHHPSRVTLLRQFNQTWLHQIIRKHNPAVPRRDIAKVLSGLGFVTFNYDRTVEQYIYQYAHHVSGLSEPQARELVEELPLLHAYGYVGSAFDPNVTAGAPQALANATSSILTYNDDVPSETVRSVRSLLQTADKVVFLGCAYHEQNIKLLFDDWPSRPPLSVFGTAFQMDEPQRERVARLLEPYGENRGLFNKNCLQYITDNGANIFAERVGSYSRPP